MKIIHSMLVIYLTLILAACGAGSTAGDLSVNDLSIVEPDETAPAPDDPNTSQPAVVTLSWTPPTENMDLTGLTDLAGYRIYYGTSRTELILLIEIGANLSTYVIENDQRILTGTRYYFGITAFNSANIESSISNIVNKDL